MNVAVVVPHMIAGGMETYVFRLGAFLQKAGHRVTIVTTGIEGEWWGRCASYGFETRAVLLKDSFNRLTHISRVRREMARYDVLLMNDARYAKAALPGLPEEIAAISVIHNDVPDFYTIAASYADLQDAAVGISPQTFEKLAPQAGRDKTVLILHGVECPPSSAPREGLTKSGGPVRLIFCGRAVQHHKNIFLLPRICALLRERELPFTLEIVGDGPDLDQLKQLFQDAGLEAYVKYSGVLRTEEVYEKYLASHILLMPSFFEGFPLVPLEAQACGCVPVVTRLPGITDVSVADGETGILADSNDETRFADAVCALAGEPSRWQAMSNAGARRIREEFSVEKMGLRYDELIGKVCAEKRGRTGLRAKRPRWNRALIGWTAILPNALCAMLKIIEL